MTILKKHTCIAVCLLLITWLMTGFAVDDEFSDEFRFFVKHRPTIQYYFDSPLAMQDMPVDYPPDRAAAYYIYRDFVLGEHWSSHMEWLALLMVLGTVSYIGLVMVKYVKCQKKQKNNERNRYES